MSLPATAESALESTESAIQEEPEPEPAPPTPISEVPAPVAPVEAPSKPKRDPRIALLNSLLKSMSQCPFPAPTSRDQSFFDTYPPLFDPRGGLKRRVMRDEEENRLGVEQEEQIELPREPSEGEPESSGSLALGGEPEDREQVRESQTFDQRRGSGQPPIQRTTTDSLFGSVGSNYVQSPNLGAIGNRNMAPLQPLYARSQSSFTDHVPPGMSAQSNVFQPQGHNRQSSRFSFATDSAGGATSVKLTANSRIITQQSSMMPPALHSQPSNPYYASSMPGPPPGLKSTGTPPNLFGQGHGLGGSGFNSGGAAKDNSQLLQDIIRGRAGASSQAHDAGKSEYLFPSFSHQYPPTTSSTPAPAPGFSASLYGTQPGAFQDIGSKQKKKGKKHRHANTSSSGGSVLVDLADPSILRMQHRLEHPQSNAGVGQGLFGGQAQGGYNPSMMYNAGYPRW